MTIADALVALGEDRSWASVWWAYGAIHHDLSNEAYERALDLLGRVDASDEARAAALMLRAEIEATAAYESQRPPDHRRQSELLTRAVELAPDWPNLHLRLAHASAASGDMEAAQHHGAIAACQFAESPTSDDPFDVALSGTGLDKSYVSSELRSLGVPRCPVSEEPQQRHP